ncbi:STAS domain-containing protein [Streptomyces bauhiniae]|uniref:STAS domain-containing protein n=1 Tax=Streptomyces bauhiniae TaxID=2340725 RepID=UPI0036632B98
MPSGRSTADGHHGGHCPAARHSTRELGGNRPGLPGRPAVGDHHQQWRHQRPDPGRRDRRPHRWPQALRQVTFIDSTGINIFLAAHLAAAQAGGRLRLAHLTGKVSRVFSLIGADGIIDCRRTLTD